MLLKSLEVSHVRNLQSLKLLLHPTMNFVVGPNGSGKTSLLEAIYLLASGRSFRTPLARKIISHQQSGLTVFGEILDAAGISHRVGISKGVEGDTLVRIDGMRRERMSDLATLLPAISIDASSFELVDGGPSERRHLLDWGLFHVEHDFLEHWKSYQTAVKQKGSLLRTGSDNSARKQLSHWNEQQAHWGERIHASRVRYVQLLQEALERTTAQYVGSLPLTLEYRPGWNRTTFPSLRECLDAGIETELEKQACCYGPHKAELLIQWDGGLARDVCSRGQKKLVLYAVRLAQVMTLFEQRSLVPLLLLDDMPAELDDHNLHSISRFLRDYPCQTFITAIHEQALSKALFEQFQDHRMFHVEHGQLIQTTSA